MCEGLLTSEDEISQWAAQLPSTDTPIQSISKTNLCSTCFQALLQSIQATAYSNYGSNLASDYAAAQKSRTLTISL